MLSRKLEVKLVSLRFSLHQQMLATSGWLAFPPLGSLPFQTPRVCFMTTMRCVIDLLSFIIINSLTHVVLFCCSIWVELSI